MKRRIASAALVLCLVLALLPVHVQAADIIKSGTCGTGVNWSLDSDGVLKISGTGAMRSYSKTFTGTSSQTTAPWGSDTKTITSIRVEDGVTSIGDYAFYVCFKATSVDIADSVTSIGENAFYGCRALTAVTIPESVTTIGKSAFSNCRALTAVTIPKSVTRLSESVFNSCSSLTTVTIPGNVAYIGRDAFLCCSSLTTITILEGVTEIGEQAFYSCYNVKKIYLPKTVDTIYRNAFRDLSRLEDVYYASSEENYKKILYKPGLDINRLFTSKTTIHYTADTPFSSYTITFDPNGGTFNNGDTKVEAGTTVNGKILLQSFPSVSCQCWQFLGWYMSKEWGSEEVVSRTIFNGDATVYALWNEYGHHKNLETISAVAPTCGTDGATEGERCSDCGVITKEPKVIPKTEAHTWGETTRIENKAATCTKKGEYACSKECSVCHTEKTWTEEIELAPHSIEIILAVPAGCETHGKTAGQRCSVCGNILEEPRDVLPNGHKEETIPAVPPTCGQPGTKGGIQCSVCDEVLKEPEKVLATGNHTPGDMRGEEITAPATCTVDGTKKVTYECSNCGQVFQKEEPIPSKGHTEVEIAAVAATCTAPGWTAGVECSVCRAVLKEPEQVEMAPHRWGPEQEEVTKPATCTEGGLKTYKKICAVCKKEESRTETFGPNGHTVVYLSEVPATCTKDGKTAGEECSVCGLILKEQKPIPAAHTNLVPVSGRPADCTHWGQTEGVRCDNCGVFTKPQEDIPPLEHAWMISSGTETITREPTCTEAGEKTITGGSTCSRCNAETTDEQTVEIPPLTHQWGEAAEEVIKPPTCKEKGIKTITRLCTRDGCQEKDEKTEELDLLAHTWGEWKTVQEPTATEAGMKERDCAVCGDKDTEEIAATGTTPVGEVYQSEEKPGGEYSKPEEKPGVEDNKPEEKPGGEDNKPEEKPGGEDSKPEEKPGDEDNKPVTPPGPVRYRIYTPGSVSGGSYDVSHSSAVQGARITVEVSPRRNYELEWLAVTNLTTGQELHLTQRGSDEYTFVMPASSVELDISYDSGRYIVYEEPQLKTGPNAWYYRDRHIYHVENGLVPDGTHITRDMLISVLYNMTSPAVISKSIGCETNDSQVWATDNGIVPDIYASGLWGFDKILSREQAAMLIFRYAGYRGCGTAQRQTITRYSDYSRLRPDARAAMSWAVATGLMPGASASTLAPRDSITCGQMGELLFKFEATILR